MALDPADPTKTLGWAGIYLTRVVGALPGLDLKGGHVRRKRPVVCVDMFDAIDSMLLAQSHRPGQEFMRSNC